MKPESDNYQIVSCIVVVVLFCSFILLTLASLSHAFNTGPESPDGGYVIDTGALP